MRRTALIGVLGFVFLSSLAQGASRDRARNGSESGAFDPLRSELRTTLNETHQRVLDYGVARRAIVGRLHLRQAATGERYLRDVYCHKVFAAHEPDGAINESSVNVEHTWPQSRFVGGPQKWMMKSDLHHLFPTDSRVNAQRGNMKFGDVTGETYPLNCAEPRLGPSPDGSPRFEPPDEHKGNVARALFYYAVHYGARIDRDEELALRAWHVQDPVDQEEMTRNVEIEKLQGNRNPFIDQPELVERISDF